MTLDIARLNGLVRTIPDYPKPGVSFRDITPMLADAPAFHAVVDALADHFADSAASKIVGIEARGFIFGAALAYRLGASFVPIRKAGKLPWAVAREDYSLEYGSDRLEIHRDAIVTGEHVLVIDDVLATGGTAAASVRLVEALGGHVDGIGLVVELTSLDGRSRLTGHRVHSLLAYP